MRYTKEVLGQVLIFSVNSSVSPEIAKEISDDINKEILENKKIEKVAIDLKNQYTIDSSVFRILSPVGVSLRKQSKLFYILNPTAQLSAFIKEMGLASLMKPIDSLQEINAETKAAPPANATVFDVNFINPFIQGVITTMKIQCDLECTPLKSTLKKQLDPSIQVDIAGLIGITSKTFTGSVSICFPEKTFLSAMSTMMGEEFLEVTSELQEGAAEFINVIFGQAKKVLNEQGHTIEKALPSVIHGKNVDVKHTTAKFVILIPFASAAGPFYLEIGTGDKS
jgi:CheY-specific phosphatase CheX/anti-anti-sigma regulatory factor